MTKTAVFILGKLRLPEEAHKRCIENIKFQMRNHDSEYYIFTWNTQHKESIEFFLTQVNEMVVLEEPDVNYLNRIKFPLTQNIVDNSQHIHRFGQYSILFGLQSLFDKIENEDRTYDYILRTRNDLMISTNMDDWYNALMSEGKAVQNKVVLPENYWCWGCGVNDHLMFGSYATMKKLYYNTMETVWYPLISSSKSFEAVIVKALNSLNISYVEMPSIYYSLLRNVGHPGTDCNGEWRLL